MSTKKVFAATKAVLVVLVSAFVLPVGANAHDADPGTSGVQPHQVGPYFVTDTVTQDAANNTTTATYTITIPAEAKDLSHTTLRIVQCSPAHEILSISSPGEVVNQDGSIDWTGHLIKWNIEQAKGTTATYSYSVAGIFDPVETDIALKTQDAYFGTVQAIGCTHERQGSIELIKDWDGTPGETTLKIGTSAGGEQVDSEAVSGADGTTGANDVDTGTYFVSESDLVDYDSALACSNGEETVEVGENGAVSVGDDDDVECTFTNTRQQGSIELRKVWEGSPGQTTLNIGTSAGTGDVDSQQTGVAGADPLTTGPNTVDTGMYFVTETNPGPYDSRLSCLNGEEVVIAQEDGSVEVGDDETIVCTFTNRSRPSAIEVRKVADPVSVSPGQTVTYTYEVENTGQTTLENVTVDDNVLGLIGTIDSLAPGEIVTLEKTMAVEEDSPTENIVTACGTDPYDDEVCDDDLERIQILLPAGPRERERPTLPRTGFNFLGYIAIALNLIAAGSAMMLHRRRSAQ